MKIFALAFAISNLVLACWFVSQAMWGLALFDGMVSNWVFLAVLHD